MALIATEYRNLCEELKYATTELNVTGNIQAIMPIIIRFETSGFPDNDGVQKTALVAVADIVDAEFKRVSGTSYNKTTSVSLCPMFITLAY